MLAGLPADLAVAVAAFVGTTADNAMVTMAMVAAAPPQRATRIATGQVIGFVLIVGAAAGMALALFEFSSRIIGLLGLVPLAIGVRGLFLLRHPHRRSDPSARAVGAGAIAAALINVGAGGDNLAAYIPLFRAASLGAIGTIAVVFVLGQVLVTMLVIGSGRHPGARKAFARIGVFAMPFLYCVVGILILVWSRTLPL